jgi:hypothetical protein
VQGRRDASLQVGGERRHAEGLSTLREPADPAVVAILWILATRSGPSVAEHVRRVHCCIVVRLCASGSQL